MRPFVSALKMHQVFSIHSTQFRPTQLSAVVVREVRSAVRCQQMQHSVVQSFALTTTGTVTAEYWPADL
jgi:hypothetical protein